jgi:hypothetical protein
MHNPKKLATLGTQDRRGNTEYTTQKHWQHWVHKTDGAIQNAQPRDTGNIGYTRPTGQCGMHNPETLATLGTQDRRGIQNAQPRDIGNNGYTRPTGQYRMHNPETLATLGTQDRRAIQNAQPRDTDNIGYTRPTGQYRMYNPETLATLGTQDRRGNTECTTQRHWQHWVHKTDGAIQNVQPRDTGNIGYTRPTGQYRMYNPETLPILGTQDTGGGQSKHKPKHRKIKQ